VGPSRPARPGYGARMPRRPDLPPAVRALLDTAAGLVRNAPSARIAIARAGGILDLAALDPEVAAAVEREVEAARAATCVRLDRPDVERALRDAWGRPAGRVLDDLDLDDPLAVTPAAQVHRGAVDGTPVAVKLRRPGVERGVRADLSLLEALVAPMRSAFPGLDAVAVLRDVREQTLDELDFEHEASGQRRVARALRPVAGLTVPRPHLDLAAPEVLVSDLAEGDTLAAGALPADARRAARALVAAFRTALVDAGLALVDPRPTHVVVAPGGTGLALLGTGVARPVDRDRARRALSAVGALRDEDPRPFATAVAGLGILPADRAAEAHALVRTVLGEFAEGPAALDAAAVARVLDRAAHQARLLLRLAGEGAPEPQDLAMARAFGQGAALLSRLGATEDWLALVAGEAG
jgi:predicted unusual protein kinase regulating ubiquinone biosynthesis (AarF/ABC1/UbiB family)